MSILSRKNIVKDPTITDIEAIDKVLSIFDLIDKSNVFMYKPSNYDKLSYLQKLGGKFSDSFSNKFSFAKTVLSDPRLLDILEGNGSDAVNSLLNNYLEGSDIDNIDYFMDVVSKRFPSYNNLPLVVINTNISSEKQVEILKKVYKQKNLPQYITLLTRRIKDLTSLDTFIEATVISNNRVKEKDDGVARIFKYVFLDDYEKVFESDVSGKVEFSKKYISYFKDKKFVRSFVNSYINVRQNRYERERCFRKLVKLMVSGVSIEEKIEILGSSPDLDEFLVDILQNDIKNLNIPTDDENILRLCKIILGTPMKDSLQACYDIFDRYSNVISVILSDSEIKDTIIKNLNKDGLCKWSNRRDNSWNPYRFETPSHLIRTIVNSLPLKDLVKVKISEPVTLVTVGMGELEKLKSVSSWSFSDTYIEFANILERYKNIIDKVDENDEESINAIKTFIVTNGLALFQMEDTNGIILNAFLDLEASSVKVSVNNTSLLSFAYNTTFKTLEYIVKKCYKIIKSDYLQEIEDNFTNIHDSLQLLSTICGNNSF